METVDSLLRRYSELSLRVHLNEAMRLFHFFLLTILASLPSNSAQENANFTLIIDGTKTTAETDDNFVCATLDWWPHDKCDYTVCAWANASIINLDLSHPLLANAIRAFKSLRIRIGGSLQDRVVYDIGKLRYPCHPFGKDKNGLFGFSTGCLRMKRWDELNHLFNKTSVLLTFGLNALYGRHQIKKGSNAWGGNWDSSNAYQFMKYTLSKGYPIDSWELGNELCGVGVGASVGADQYGKDVIALKRIINQLYEKTPQNPSLVAPGGFFDRDWFARFLQVSGPNVVDFVSHHMYNLGPGSDPKLVDKIVDPNYLSRVLDLFNKLNNTIKESGPWASPWVGESGGAYNSGGPDISNTFVNSFWYLDQLGMSAKFNTKVYCRQSLVGGNYGLLNTTTFVPNPDYYSALLWHRLMGKGVLSVDAKAASPLRAYAHCSKGREGITLLLINFSNQTNFMATVHTTRINQPIYEESAFIRVLKKKVSFVGLRETLFREEYHLTPKDGFLQSRTMLLNGTPLEVTEEGKIPTLNPALVNIESSLSIAPLSIAFIVIPYFEAPACI